MFDSYRLCAEFMGMQWQPPLWGKGGAPDAVLTDDVAWPQPPPSSSRLTP